jgi:F0F1-type ATP synthase assembly protein I
MRKQKGTFGKFTSANDYFGLALSFSVTMLVSVVIMMWIGVWIDKKLGTGGIFWLIFTLGGIYSGFHLFIEQVEEMQNPRDINERDWDLKHKPEPKSDKK